MLYNLLTLLLKHRRLSLLFLLFTAWGFFLDAHAQPLWYEMDHEVHLDVEAQATVGRGENAPFWLTSNRNGLAGMDARNGALRLFLHRPVEADSDRVWHVGYGLEGALTYGNTSRLMLQQAYAEVDFQKSRFTLGQKVQQPEINHPTLSTGAWVLGNNARPVPMLRWELYDWWNIAGDGNWAALKLHVAYGMMTDGGWQEDYLLPQKHYAKRALLHTKSGYLRLGNPDFSPFIFVGGLEMATQFGGHIYNVGRQAQDNYSLRVGTKDFWYAFWGKGGSDPTDGAGYENSAGNTLGAWRAALTYRHPAGAWSVKAYYDHYFEDQSQLFFQYGWYDGLWGIEFNLPRNRFVSTLVGEYVRMDHQSGPVYHDHTPQVPDQVSGVDNYYNHNLYQGWQNYGRSMGNALFASPIYKRDGTLDFSYNRFRTYHFGVAGQPTPDINYRLLYTHLWSWGTYAVPLPEVRHQHSFLAEVRVGLPNLAQRRLGRDFHERSLTAGWSIGAAVAFDGGTLLGRNFGLQLSIMKQGLLSSF